MKYLPAVIERTEVPSGSVALWWLGQAGFACKCDDGAVLYVDPYFSDVVEAVFGFKRLSLAPVEAAQVRADWLISTHEHLDHLDAEALPALARANPWCRFMGPVSCREVYESAGIAPGRQVILEPGRQYEAGRVTVRTAKADHGNLSATALSLLLDFGEVSILFTGDTSFSPELIRPLTDRKPDVLIPCINGRLGNMGPAEAAALASVAGARVAIPCHFWMFHEHGGDPGAFLEACAAQCPRTEARLLSPGEGVLVTTQSAERIEC